MFKIMILMILLLIKVLNLMYDMLEYTPRGAFFPIGTVLLNLLFS